jgi:hypothetical protein
MPYSVMFLVEGAPADPITPWLQPLYSLGGFGLLLALLLWGRVVTKSTHDEMRADRDAWKHAAELAREDRQSQIDRDAVLLRLLEEIKAQRKGQH